jgi:hypothetical protein
MGPDPGAPADAHQGALSPVVVPALARVPYDATDGGPSRRQRGPGREAGGQGVIFTTRKHPVHDLDTELRGCFAKLIVDREGGRVEIDGHAALLGDVPEVGGFLKGFLTIDPGESGAPPDLSLASYWHLRKRWFLEDR